MRLCNEVLLPPGDVVAVCQEAGGTEHSHDDARTRPLRPGEAFTVDETFETLELVDGPPAITPTSPRVYLNSSGLQIPRGDGRYRFMAPGDVARMGEDGKLYLVS